jgi:hypothetical protein
LQDLSFELPLDYRPAAELTVIPKKLLPVGDDIGNSSVSKADLSLSTNRVYAIQPMQHRKEKRKHRYSGEGLDRNLGELPRPQNEDPRQEHKSEAGDD